MILISESFNLIRNDPKPMELIVLISIMQAAHTYTDTDIGIRDTNSSLGNLGYGYEYR